MTTITEKDTMMIFSQEELDALQRVLPEGISKTNDLLKDEYTEAKGYSREQIGPHWKSYDIAIYILKKIENRLCEIAEKQDTDREVWRVITAGQGGKL